jgi:hypothetical protein
VLYVKCNGLDGRTIPEAINREICVLESIYYLHYALTYDVDVRTIAGMLWGTREDQRSGGKLWIGAGLSGQATLGGGLR